MNHSPLRVFVLAAALAGIPRTQESLAQLVPTDAKFACFVDLQAMLNLVGRDLLQAAIAKHADDEGVQLRGDWNKRLDKEWGIDPLRDLQGLLLFGTELEREEPNFVLLTSEKIDGALDKLREMGALASEQHDGVTVEHLDPAKMLAAFGVEEAVDVDVNAYIHVRKLSGQGPQRAIMIGTALDQLLPAVRAPAGRDEKRGERALKLDPRKGCIMYLEVADALEGLLGETPASRMASKTKHFSMQLSEAAGEIELLAALQTESAKDARQIAALVNGLKALVSLVEPDEDVPQGVLEALDGAHADVDGDRVTLQFKVARALLDQARQAIRAEMGVDDGDEKGNEKGNRKPSEKPSEKGNEQPKPGASSKRSIR